MSPKKQPRPGPDLVNSDLVVLTLTPPASDECPYAANRYAAARNDVSFLRAHHVRDQILTKHKFWAVVSRLEDVCTFTARKCKSLNH